MKKIRIHNDIRISWGITTNGQQISLEKRKLQVQVVVYNRVMDIEDFTVKGNVIIFDFPGKEQKYCGMYTLVCKDETNGYLNTLDQIEAFELVPHTANEAGVDNEEVALEVVNLSTDRDSSTIGKAATVRIGNVYTLPSGAYAYVRNVGTINDAVLEFGIPSGSGGENGLDGVGVIADPPSVTFNPDENGVIPEKQDKLVHMKIYIGGQVMGDAKIVKITTTNFKADIPIEDDGCSFWLRGSNLETVDTIDLDGNPITIPATIAEAYVVCKILDSELLYAATVRAYTNTQTFYTSLVSNQREFKQTFTQLSNTLDETGLKVEKYYSEFQQTAQNISMTVSRNKIDTDNSIEQARSELSVTADAITSTVEKNKQDADGKIENTRSEIKQTADSLTSTIEANKKDADGKIESAKSEFKQTADEISSTVEANKKDADGKIESTRSELKQTASSLTSTIESNKKDADGKIESAKSRISQTEKDISTLVEKTDKQGTRISTIEQNVNGISQTVGKAATKEQLEQNVNALNSSIDNTLKSAKSYADGIGGGIRNDYASTISTVKQNSHSWSVAAGAFDANGKLIATSGLVTDTNFASMFSKQFTATGGVVQSQISTFISKDEAGNLISNATIQADHINFSGHTVTLNTGELVINSSNFKLDSSGNCKIGPWNINSDGIYVENYSYDGSTYNSGLYPWNLWIAELENGVDESGVSLVPYGRSDGDGMVKITDVSSKARSRVGVSVNFTARDSSKNLVGLLVKLNNGGYSPEPFAVYAMQGMYAGLRPKTKNVSANYYIDDTDNVIHCENTSDISIYLPATPQKGQMYLIIQHGTGKVTVRGNGKKIWCWGTDGGDSFESSTRYQFNWLFYNGTYWDLNWHTH